MKKKQGTQFIKNVKHSVAEVPVENIIGENDEFIRLRDGYIVDRKPIKDRLKQVMQLSTAIYKVETSREFDEVKEDLLDTIAEKSSNVFCSLLIKGVRKMKVKRCIPFSGKDDESMPGNIGESECSIPLHLSDIILPVPHPLQNECNLMDTEKSEEEIEKAGNKKKISRVTLPGVTPKEFLREEKEKFEKRSLASKKGWKTRRKNKNRKKR